jgi:hypothetical protein
MRTFDRITIYVLAFTTCALALFLMLQRGKRAPQVETDRFNLEGFEERQRTVRLERKGKPQ